MTEISNEIRATEVHKKAQAYYQASEQFGYKFLMEVKTIRDEKLFKDLGYEDFEQYTQLNFNYSRNTMNERILSADAFGEEYNRALGSYGKHKTRQLAQMPEKERKQVMEDGIPTENGIKSIEQATTREIEEYKRQLKEKDKQIAALTDSYNELANQPQPTPVVKTVEVKTEVIPSDYEQLKKANEQLKKLQRDHQQLLNERAEVDEKSRKYDELNEAIQISHGLLNETQRKISEYNNLHKLIKESNEFLNKASALVYSDISGIMQTDVMARNEIKYLTDNLERFTKDLNQLLSSNLIIEGEFNHG